MRTRATAVGRHVVGILLTQPNANFICGFFSPRSSQNLLKADDLETAMDQLMDEQNQREEAEEEVRTLDK